MDAIEAIMTRRSIRKYTGQPVDDEMITTILKAGMAAPSAGDQRPWHFVVSTDSKVMSGVCDFHPHSKMLMTATAAILICGEPALEKHQDRWVQDCAASMQNMLLAAHALGLGAVWVGVYPVEERIEGMRDLFGIPQDIIPMSMISLGYPAEAKPPADRYDEARVHRERW